VVVGGLGCWEGPWSGYARSVSEGLSALQAVRVYNGGLLPHPEVLGLLAGADLLVHPAVFEPFGLVVLEAMANSCLVLSTDADGPAELLEAPWGHRVPFRVPRLRVQGLTASLQALMELPRDSFEPWKVLASQAAERFTWRRCALAHLAAMKRAQAAATAMPPRSVPPRKRRWHPQLPSTQRPTGQAPG